MHPYRSRPRSRPSRRWLAPLTGLALCLAPPPVAATGTLPGSDALGPLAAWWPPEPAAAGAFAGWAMSAEGPMAMPPSLHAALYGPGAAVANADLGKLRDVLRRIWEHLASRVDGIAEAEGKSELYEKEVLGLSKRAVEGEKVLGRLFQDVTKLSGWATDKRKELETKFDEIGLVRGRLMEAFKGHQVEIRDYFEALRQARRKTMERHDRLERRVRRSREQLDEMRMERTRSLREVVRTAEVPQAPGEEPAARRGTSGGSRATATEATSASLPREAMGPDPAAGEAADDRLYGSSGAGSGGKPAGRAGGTSRAAPTGGSDQGVLASGGTRKTAREILEERMQLLKERGAAGKGGRSRERGDELPGSRDRDRGRTGSGEGADSPSDPEPQGRGEEPPRRGPPPDADALLEEFLGDPNVQDRYLSKRPGSEGGRLLAARSLPPVPAHQPGPASDVPETRSGPGLGAFARELDLELAETVRREGIAPGRGFSGSRPAPEVPSRGRGGMTVTDILAELDRLEK